MRLDPVGSDSRLTRSPLHSAHHRTRDALLVTCFLLLAPALDSCSIRRMAAKSFADALTSGPDVFGRDDDPELIRDALPFGLKTLESLLEILPDHRGLLLASCRGYTQYAYAFVQADADLIEARDPARAAELKERALHLYLRARGFGLRGLALRHKGIADRLQRDPVGAAAELRKEDLPFAYWTAASWGSAISVGSDRPELVVDLSAVKALLEQALTLDESYEQGALHEAMIILEALPPAMGGSAERARMHFQRAVELSGGVRAGPYVTLASTVSVQSQNRAEFERLLRQALEVDPNRVPDQRLANLVIQQKARWLLAHEDDWFLDTGSPSDEDKK
jgi:predicted anti-sigma-YlaC factor YlaD